MVRTHISISDEIDNIIKKYCNKYDIKYSQAVAKLVELGDSNVELNKTIRINNDLMDRLYSKMCYTKSLLEQFYSDMEIDELTNPKENIALKEFRNKQNRFED